MVRGRTGLGKTWCMCWEGVNREEAEALPLMEVTFPRHRVRTGKILGRDARAKFPPSPRS